MPDPDDELLEDEETAWQFESWDLEAFSVGEDEPEGGDAGWC